MWARVQDMSVVVVVREHGSVLLISFFFPLKEKLEVWSSAESKEAGEAVEGLRTKH